jgi:hypothetical protein
LPTLRTAAAGKPAMLAAIDRVLAPDRPAAVWIYATPPDRMDVVLVLPVKGDNPKKALEAAGLAVSGTAHDLTIEGHPSRIVGDRLLVANEKEALRAAAKADAPSVAAGGPLASGVIELDALPESVRNAWIERLHTRTGAGAPGALDTVARAVRVEAFADVLKDGSRIDVTITPSDARQQLTLDVVPREGSWLAQHVGRNTGLASRLVALVPSDAKTRMSWSEIEVLDEPERAKLLMWLDELEAVLSRYPKQLGFVGGAELEVVPLLQDMLELAELVLEPQQFDYVAWTPDDGGFVIGVRGLPGPRLDGVFVRTIATLKRHELPWVSSVSTKKQGKRQIHEIVAVTPDHLQSHYGPNTAITFATSGDVMLLSVRSKSQKAVMPGLLEAVARARDVPVAMQEARVDVTQLTAVLPGGSQLAQWLGGETDALAFDHALRIDGARMVATLHLDVGAWLRALGHASAS